MGCRSCDLTRIYKQFEEKRRKKAQAEAEARAKAAAAASKPVIKENPITMVIDKSQPTKTKKRKSDPKVEEENIEIIEKKEDTPAEEPIEKSVDAE